MTQREKPPHAATRSVVWVTEVSTFHNIFPSPHLAESLCRLSQKFRGFSSNHRNSRRLPPWLGCDATNPLLLSFPSSYQILWDNWGGKYRSSRRGSAGWAERLRLSGFRFFPAAAAADCQYCLESVLREAFDSWILHRDLLPLTEVVRWKERNNSERAATSEWNNTQPAGGLLSLWLEEIA